MTLRLEAMNGETLRDWAHRERRIAGREYGAAADGSVEAAYLLGVIDMLDALIRLTAGTGINPLSD